MSSCTAFLPSCCVPKSILEGCVSKCEFGNTVCLFWKTEQIHSLKKSPGDVVHWKTLSRKVFPPDFRLQEKCREPWKWELGGGGRYFFSMTSETASTWKWCTKYKMVSDIIVQLHNLILLCGFFPLPGGRLMSPRDWSPSKDPSLETKNEVQSNN